jgi:hypothetical protein
VPFICLFSLTFQPYWTAQVPKGWEEGKICDDLRRLRADHDLWEADVEAPRPRPHPLFFGDVPFAERKQQAFGELDKLAQESASLFTFSAVLDAWQHNGPIQESCGWPRLLRRTNADLVLLKEWADANPEYLLVLMSDHGQNKRVPGYVLHGEGGDGNDGVLLVYNSQLIRQGKYDDASLNHTDLPFLHVADVGATILSLMDSVDFPLTSIGYSHAGSPARHVSAEPIVDSMTLCRNLLQLVRSAELRKVAPATRRKAVELIKEILAEPTTTTSVSDFERIDAVAFELRHHLFSDAEQSRWIQVVCVGIIALCVAASAVGGTSSFEGGRARILGLPSVLFSLVPVCFGLMEFAFAWYAWGSLYVAGVPFFVAFLTAGGAAWGMLRGTQDARSQLVLARLIGSVAALVAVNKLVRHSLGLDVEPRDPHALPTGQEESLAGPAEPGVLVTVASMVGSLLLTVLVVVLLDVDSKHQRPWYEGIPRPVRRLLVGVVVWGDAFGLARNQSGLFLPNFLGPLYGIHMLAFAAYACLGACLLRILWNLVRSRFSDRGIHAFCRGVAAVFAAYSWILYQDSLMARVSLLLGWWACGVALGELNSSAPAMRHVLGMLAVCLVVLLSTQITPLDFNAQADFSRWGLFANGELWLQGLCFVENRVFFSSSNTNWGRSTHHTEWTQHALCEARTGLGDGHLLCHSTRVHQAQPGRRWGNCLFWLSRCRNIPRMVPQPAANAISGSLGQCCLRTSADLCRLHQEASAVRVPDACGVVRRFVCILLIAARAASTFHWANRRSLAAT